MGFLHTEHGQWDMNFEMYTIYESTFVFSHSLFSISVPFGVESFIFDFF